MTQFQIEHRERKNAIRAFMQQHYTGERLAALLAHAQSGRLAYWSCCCFIGCSNADHALQCSMFSSVHTNAARLLPGGWEAEVAYAFFGDHRENPDARRRRILIPMIRAEMRRRERVRAIAEAEAECEEVLCRS